MRGSQPFTADYVESTVFKNRIKKFDTPAISSSSPIIPIILPGRTTISEPWRTLRCMSNRHQLTQCRCISASSLMHFGRLAHWKVGSCIGCRRTGWTRSPWNCLIIFPQISFMAFAVRPPDRQGHDFQT